MELLETLTFWLFYLFLFFGLYILVMGVYRAHLAGRLTPALYALTAPWVAIGLLMDVVANLLIATFIFLEPPREWLVTTRLTRYRADEPLVSWRYRWACWICDHLLDVFDPTGNHC